MTSKVGLTLDVISARGLVQRSPALQIHILFRNQLLRSRNIEWSEEDPVFNLSFPLLLNMQGEEDPTILIYVSAAEIDNNPLSERKGKLFAAAIVDYRYPISNLLLNKHKVISSISDFILILKNVVCRVADAYPSDFISVELLPCVDGDGIGEGVSMNGGK